MNSLNILIEKMVDGWLRASGALTHEELRGVMEHDVAALAEHVTRRALRQRGLIDPTIIGLSAKLQMVAAGWSEQ